MNDLNKLRQEIDAIDDQILKLLELRFDATQKVGARKKDHGLQVYDAEREGKILMRLNDKLTNDAYRDSVETIFKLILEMSKNLQRRL